jgi:hypothetical protein
MPASQHGRVHTLTSYAAPRSPPIVPPLGSARLSWVLRPAAGAPATAACNRTLDRHPQDAWLPRNRRFESLSPGRRG